MLKVVAETPAQQNQAESIASSLQAPLLPVADVVEDTALLVWVSDEGVGLRPAGRRSPKPVYVDFLSGVMGYRQHHMGLKNELIAKAVGLKSNQLPRVLDATAGFARDAFVLAALGCQVTLLEQHPVVALLLKSGLERAREDPTTAPIIERMRFCEIEAVEYLATITEKEKPDVVYLDPMFPVREKSAKVKKDMQVLHLLLQQDANADALLAPALATARKRVVVKRPRHAPPLANTEPQICFSGKSSRFDVYLTN